MAFESRRWAASSWSRPTPSSAATTSIDVKHEIVNVGDQPRDRRTCTCSSCATATRRAGDSSFYSTFTGPAIYTEQKKFQKIDFKDIEKRKVEARPATCRPTAGSRWCSTTSLSAWLLDVPGSDAITREFRVRKISATTCYSVGMLAAAAASSRRAPRKTFDASLFAGPAGREQARGARARPRAGQGLRHLHDPRQAAVLAADAAAQASSATGAGRSSAWWCC